MTDKARFRQRWSLSGAWVFGSGRPFTPALSAGPVWLPSGTTVYGVNFGPKNSDRLPMYHRLDLTLQRDFRLRHFKSTVGATVFNVYNRPNIWVKQYQAIGTSLATNDVTMLGRAVNVFARVGF